MNCWRTWNAGIDGLEQRCSVSAFTHRHMKCILHRQRGSRAKFPAVGRAKRDSIVSTMTRLLEHARHRPEGLTFLMRVRVGYGPPRKETKAVKVFQVNLTILLLLRMLLRVRSGARDGRGEVVVTAPRHGRVRWTHRPGLAKICPQLRLAGHRRTSEKRNPGQWAESFAQQRSNIQLQDLEQS